MKRKFAIILMGIMAVVGIGIFVIINTTDLGTDDASALYGGRLEFGYPYAGFLINQNTKGGSASCGFTFINNSTAVTAGHCVDDAKNVYIGQGQFTTDLSKLIKVDKVTVKSGWVKNKRRADDFTILSFKPQSDLRSFAEISSPIEGCYFRVVAYGRTENPAEAATKPRKSALLCATEITPTTFKVTGADSGICFGDSGSPVFYEDTNQLVGSIVSIIKPEVDGDAPCAFGNEAIVVRSDTNVSLINNNIRTFDSKANDIGVSEPIIVEVADETIADQAVKLRNFLIENNQIIALAGVLSLVTLILLIFSGRRKGSHYT